jgi:5'-3' exonuclease
MRLHVVDGTYELFRAHFAPRPGHRAAAGWDAKATVGLATSLLALLHDPGEAVTHVAVAFDNPIRSFRNDLFAGYKSDEGVPPELRAQFDAAEDAVRALGVTVWSMREHEADDALATAAARFRGVVEQVRLLTPDKDLGQCLAGREVVMVDRMRRKELDEAGLLARRGIAPASVPDWLALVGDDADGIPGLAGFGEATAARLLAAHGHLEAIPASAAAWPPSIRGAAQLAATLAAEREAALLYRRLATLVTDVPLAESLDDLRWRGLPRARLEAWCAEVDARTLVASLDGRGARWDGGGAAPDRLPGP